MTPLSRWHQKLLAGFVLACMLVVSIAACSDHDHSANSSRRCEVCHFGHMPSVQGASIAEVLPPSFREWRQMGEEPQLVVQAAPIESATRAPPA